VKDKQGKRKIDDIEYTESRKAKDAMATEVVDNLILKQHTESTRISDRKDSSNYNITRKEAASRIGYGGRNRGRGGYEGRGGHHTQVYHTQAAGPTQYPALSPSERSNETSPKSSAAEPTTKTMKIRRRQR